MNTPTTPRRTQLTTTLILTLTAATTLTGCSSEPPAPLPVHAEVEWDNDTGPTGPLEDDPRVQAVRDYLIWSNASTNALNYSSPQLDHVATFGIINSTATATVNQIKSDTLILHQGPSRFHVTQIDDTNPDRPWIEGCLGRAPAWTRDNTPDDWYQHTDLGDGIYQRTHRAPSTATFVLVKEEGRWKVDSQGGGSVCDAGIGDAPTGVYTTPPDLDLLTEAFPEMVVSRRGVNYFEE